MTKKPLDEETLRETRDDLLTRVTDQQRQFGMLPDVKAAEEFIDPILRKVEVDHLTPAKPSARREVPGDPSLSERGEKLADGSSRFRNYAGTVSFGKPGAGLTVHHQPPWAREKKDSANMAAARKCFRAMRQDPDWRHRVEAILFASDSHREKEKKLMAVLLDYVRLFGDPRKKKDRRIQL